MSRRTIAVGITRHTPDRTTTMRATEAGVTGRISPNTRPQEQQKGGRK